ncbi:hypothetical protein AJ79_08818 [Helicocarpus griseus UAMH5409]|uniref:Uncharacterized protein n=1 Tax=Helicocarpus griseus UAMH5409 TaxID=1447875 RepID=A0A2B7WP67_9EURO|nr:hypothetical protein AJ79_08818 [Helicocarpus griseus UAMH5409]
MSRYLKTKLRSPFPISSSHINRFTLSPTRRTFTSTPPALNSNAQQSAKDPSAHTSIYKSFGRAFAKVFLGGVLTYQIIYWAWLRLEVDEERVRRDKEIAELEKKAKALSPQKE